MDLIVFDFEADEEYKLKNIKVKELNNAFETVKVKYMKNQTYSKIMIDSFFFGAMAFSILLLTKTCTTGNLRVLFHSQNNLFKNSKIIISDEEVEEICDILEKKFGVTIEEENKDEYLLLEAINRNKHLTEEEKDFCYKYIDLFIDNPYINKEKVYYALLNLNISYVERPKNMNPGVSAVYKFLPDDIHVYNDDEQQSSLAHELVHCIYFNEKSVNFPRFFNEGMAELLANEYFAINPYYEASVYPYEICAIKMLCEATSSDTVLKAFSSGDMSYIIKEMAEYIGSEEEASNAIDILSNVIDEYFYDKEISYSLADFDEKCLSKFRNCVHNKILDDDKNYDGLSYDYNESLFKTIGFSACTYSDYIENFGIDCKGYFSQNVIEKNSENDNTKVLTK